MKVNEAGSSEIGERGSIRNENESERSGLHQHRNEKRKSKNREKRQVIISCICRKRESGGVIGSYIIINGHQRENQPS